MSKNNVYECVTLEEFVQLIPQRTDVVYVGQRQSGRTLVMDLINLIQRYNGDPTKVVPYDFSYPADGVRVPRLSPPVGTRTLIYKGQKHVCSYGRLDAAQDAGEKRVYQICQKSYTEAPIADLPAVWVVQLSLATKEQVFLLKTQKPGGDWAVTAVSVKVAGADPFGPLAVVDASEDLHAIMLWLHRNNLVPTSAAPLANPYWWSEEEYARVLERGSTGVDALKHLMAQEFFKVSEGASLRTNVGTPNERLYDCTVDAYVS